MKCPPFTADAPRIAPMLRATLTSLALAASCCAAPAWAAPVQASAQAGADARLQQIIRRAEATPAPTSPAAPQDSAAWWGGPRVVHEVSSRASQLVINALSFLGVRYRYGGDHASSGVDCSGLVRRVYQETLGLVLPHNAAQQSREGEKVAENELRPGDLVFFNTLRRAFSHVGIYIGNGQFVHAPRPGERVQIANLDSPYWARRFDGARRLITHAADPLLPSAQAASLHESPTAAEDGSADDSAQLLDVGDQPGMQARQAPAPTTPPAAMPISNAVPDGATPATEKLMAGAVLPRPTAALPQP